MKRLVIYGLLFLAPGILSAQRLAVGNADYIATNDYMDRGYMIQSDRNEFYWISGCAASTNIVHPLLSGLSPNDANTYFIKYDAWGKPIFSNYFKGTNYITSVFTFDGGLKVLSTAWNQVVAADGTTVDLSGADMMEILTSYDRQGSLERMINIWVPKASEYPYSYATMDRKDGSIYVYGYYSAPLEVEGYGLIGSEWLGDYIYVIKYDRGLNLVWVFTAGFVPGMNETGYFNEIKAFALDNEEIFVSGTFDALGSGPMIGDELLPTVGDITGTFGFILDKDGQKVWVQRGDAKNQYAYETNIYYARPLRNGDLVLAGVTTSGYYKLGQMTASFPNGDGYLNQFVFRIGRGGALKWMIPFNTNSFYGEKGGLKSIMDARKSGESVNEQPTTEFYYDAFDVDQTILNIAGLFMNDSMVIGGKEIPLTDAEGAFVSAIDLEQGRVNWTFPLASSYIALTGFDGDLEGNVVLQGRSGDIQRMADITPDTVAGKELIFHLGLGPDGHPLWFNNAYLQQNNYGAYGSDMEVLPNGQIFTSLTMTYADNMEFGDSSVFADYTESNWVLSLETENEVAGTIWDTEGNAVYPGYVKAFKTRIAGSQPVVDSVELSPDGTYHFSRLFPGMYTFQVVADPMAYPDALKTYVGGQSSWEHAGYNAFKTNDKNMVNDITLVEVKKLTPTDGSGQVSGSLKYEEDQGTLKGTLARPVTKGTVLIIKNDKKSVGQGGQVIAYDETDDFGNFEFTNVPDGNFILVVDIPGLNMLETHHVTISGNTIAGGFDYTVSEEGIYTFTGVGIRPYQTESFSFYPNPGNGTLYMEFPGEGDYHMEIFDAAGRLVSSRDMLSVSGTRRFDLPLKEPGIYLIRVEGMGKSATLRYVKE